MAEQLPPEMMGQVPPEMMGAAPPMPPDMAVPQEEVVEEGIIEAPVESEMLNMDEDKASDVALRMITQAKEELYGEGFDKYVDVMQRSENIVEDAAAITLDLLSPEISAADSLGLGVPVSHLMDITGEVVSEVYDFSVQTGTYAPSSEEELTRNQNITVTMVAGELGKQFGSVGNIPPDQVSSFIEGVMGGEYNDATEPELEGEIMPEMPIAPEAMPVEEVVEEAPPQSGIIAEEVPVEEMPV